MKKFGILFIFLLSFHSPVRAMMLAPVEQEQSRGAKLLRPQSQINETVCSIAQDVYQTINRNWTYVQPQTTISVNSPFWEAKWLDGKGFLEGQEKTARFATLVLKTKPERIIEALDDLINKPAVVECTTAVTTAKIFCMKALLGEQRFKGYAKAFYFLLGKKEGWTTDQFFHELPLQFLQRMNGDAVPGSVAYITNLQSYRVIKPNGNSMGFNVICLNNDRYISFGRIFKDGPQPLEAIEQYDLERFCDHKDVEQEHEEHIRICQNLKKKPTLFSKARYIDQKEYFDFYWIFDAQKVNDFFESNEVILEEASNINDA